MTPALLSVSAKHLRKLTKLTALTRLELQSLPVSASVIPPIAPSLLRVLPAFRSLRALKCSVAVMEPPDDGLMATLQQDLTRLQELDLT